MRFTGPKNLDNPNAGRNNKSNLRPPIFSRDPTNEKDHDNMQNEAVICGRPRTEVGFIFFDFQFHS